LQREGGNPAPSEQGNSPASASCSSSLPLCKKGESHSPPHPPTPICNANPSLQKPGHTNRIDIKLPCKPSLLCPKKPSQNPPFCAQQTQTLPSVPNKPKPSLLCPKKTSQNPSLLCPTNPNPPFCAQQTQTLPSMPKKTLPKNPPFCTQQTQTLPSVPNKPKPSLLCPTNPNPPLCAQQTQTLPKNPPFCAQQTQTLPKNPPLCTQQTQTLPS
ncbi:unnamed protein product, partial [Coccothraustes coccothraustes]